MIPNFSWNWINLYSISNSFWPNEIIGISNFILVIIWIRRVTTH